MSPGAIRARVVSYFPMTAPLAMPNRVAMGAAGWWERPVAAALTLAAIAALVWFGGRVYSRAVLHTRATLKLRDAWTAEPPTAGALGTTTALEVPPGETGSSRHPATALTIAIAVAVGGIAMIATSDVIIGIAVGAAAYAIGTKMPRLSVPKHPHSSRH